MPDETVLVYVGDEGWCDVSDFHGHVVSRALWDEYVAAVKRADELREKMRAMPIIDTRPYVEPGPNDIDMRMFGLLVPQATPLRNPVPRS